jgi:hypothetical protein
MRILQFTIRRLMLAVMVLACGIAFLVWVIRGPEEAGAAEAERDIAAGVLCLKTYGLPAHWFFDYSNLMKSKLGVEIRPVAGCLVDDTLVRNVGAYNRRMDTEINRRFGVGAQDKIFAEAQNPVHSAIGVDSL